MTSQWRVPDKQNPAIWLDSFGVCVFSVADNLELYTDTLVNINSKAMRSFPF